MMKRLVVVTVFTAVSLSSSSIRAASAGAIPLSCKQQAQDLYWTSYTQFWNGHFSEGVDTMKKAQAADPKCVAANLFLAEVVPSPDAKKNGDAAAAEVAKLPEPERSYLSVAVAGRSGDTAGALAHAKKLVEHKPDSWVAHMVLGMQQNVVGAKDQWLAGSKKATELAPKEGATWNQLAYANVYLRKYDDALAALKKYTEVAPTEPNAFDTMGDVLFLQGKVDDGDASFKKALEVSKNSFYTSWSGVAGARFMTGDWSGGREALKKLRDAEPMPSSKLYADIETVWSFVAEGKAKEALAGLDLADAEAKRLSEDNLLATLPTERVRILIELGQLADAQQRLDASSKLDVSKLSEGAQRALRLSRAALSVRIAARSGRVADAERALMAVEAEAKLDPSNVGAQDQARVARAEVAMAKKDAKGAVAHLSACDMDATYCQWRLALAQAAAGDKAGSQATRDRVMKAARRDLGYVYARTRVASMK